MKILIVDDNTEKLKNVARVLKKVEGLSEDNIISAINIDNAKKLICSTKFDLVVLDLNMPETITDDPTGKSGLDFIDEIIGINCYQKPKDILVLTEYQDLVEKYGGSVNRCIFPILKYDSTSTVWEEYLIHKVRYIIKSNLYKQQQKNEYEIAIVTAVQVETTAVKRLFNEWKTLRIEGDPSIYYTTTTKSKDKDCKIVFAQQFEMGMTAAATLSSKMIYHFKPKYIIMVGIAAGIGNTNYGDIIFPSEIWNYSNGKYVSKMDNESVFQLEFETDPKYISLTAEIKELSNQDFKAALHTIKDNYSGESNICDINIIHGTLACGSAVVANRDVVREMVQGHARKAVGLDMESYGVFYAAVNGATTTTVPICMKSICDFADKEKNDKYQAYAAYTSASFMKYFVETYLDI